MLFFPSIMYALPALEATSTALQVLHQVLESWDVRITPMAHPDMKSMLSTPTRAAGYICNLSEHWFTVRPVLGQWWNFNSINPAPQLVSDTYLDAFLHTLQEQDWTIYVIEGDLPAQADPSMVCNNGVGRLWTEQEVRSEYGQMRRPACLVCAHMRLLACKFVFLLDTFSGLQRTVLTRCSAARQVKDALLWHAGQAGKCRRNTGENARQAQGCMGGCLAAGTYAGRQHDIFCFSALWRQGADV
jgi:Josephin